MTSAWKNAAQYIEQLELLTQIVDESGGRILEVGAPAEIRPVFIDILKELREQYVLGFYPSDRQNDGSWHKVKVEVAGAGIDVRRREDMWITEQSYQLSAVSCQLCNGTDF